MKNDFRLRLYIESKRGSKGLFFIAVVSLKDFVVNNIKRFNKSLFNFYCSFILKDKYNLVFVIAKYKEDVSWLKKFPYKYFLYNKDSVDFPNSIKLQNVGREAHTYLTYIIDNYNSLPHFVGFLQGAPFDYSFFLAQRLDKFKGQGFHPLSPVIKYNIDDEYEYKYMETVKGSTLKYFGLKIGIENFEFPFGAQFIVSRENLLKHSLEEYKYLLNKLSEVEDQEAGCTRFPAHKKPCPCLGEYSAWMLEIWWPILFEDGAERGNEIKQINL